MQEPDNVGRDDEWSEMWSILSSPNPTPHALVLQGEPGIGKTSLWEAAVRRAATTDMTVLSARAGQAEVRLSFSVLGDLLGPLLEQTVDLPPPQRDALEIALLKRDAASAPLDARSVGLAVLTLMSNSVPDGRLLVAMDDAQWIDGSSKRVLGFVLRRLHGPARVLVTMRSEEPPGGQAFLDPLFGLEEVSVLRLGPLSVDNLGRLIGNKLSARPSRPTIERLHRLSGGNPFYALQLLRAGGSDLSDLDPASPTLPATLSQVVASRLEEVSAAAKQAAVVVSATPQPVVTKVRTILAAMGADDDALEQAIEGGVIELEGSALRMTHPVFGVALYSSLTLRKRLELHGLLARFAEGDEERARHLALATIDADPETASLLDAAARAAYVRGAPDAAAELVQRARRLTPSDHAEDLTRRAADIAEFLLEAGDVPVAENLLDEALAVAPLGASRSRCLQVLARFRFFGGRLKESQDLWREAAATSEDPRLRAACEEGLGIASWLRGDGPAAAAHAAEAARYFELVGDRVGLAETLGESSYFETLLGEGIPLERFKRALSLEESAPHVRILRRPSFWMTLPWVWVDDIETQRAALEALAARATEEGDEVSLPYVLQCLVEAECRLGRTDDAQRHAFEAAEAASPTGREQGLDAALNALGLVVALKGEVEEARALARRGLTYSGETGSLLSALRHRSVLALAELSVGNHEDAVEAAAPLVSRMEAAGYREPGLLRFVPDLVEALIMLGRGEEGAAILTPFEERAERLHRPTAIAAARRCRALSLMGDTSRWPEMQSLCSSALELHARHGDEFGRARTLLVLGILQRRAKQRRAARETLATAEDLFRRMQATLWAERARSEASRIGGRATSPTTFTPTEERVARMAADGMTNKEIAGELFVSPKTVEVNLTRVYRKLGIVSRSELRRTLSRERTNEGQT